MARLPAFLQAGLHLALVGVLATTSCVAHGQGMPIDRAVTFKQQAEAASAGSAPAAYALARHFSGLTGEALDLRQAAAYLVQAAERGHVPAQVDLGFLYYDGNAAVAKDLAASFRWFREAARHGAARAECMLGDFYLHGWGGVRQDPAEALRWYRRGAAAEDACAPRAQFALYRSYAEGLGVRKDMPTAIAWLKKAAEAGNPRAQRALGRTYEKGEGLTQDSGLARLWLRKSREGVAPHDDHEHDLPSFAQVAPSTAPAASPAPTRAVAPALTVRTIGWDALVPSDWDPLTGLKDVDTRSLADNDPRAAALLQRLRKHWDEAPLNAAMDGQAVRVPGYVVPLEQGAQGLRELLLVPHFGACIHTPPPPSNQIIHVRLDKPNKSLSSMDTVWISGTLKLLRATTAHGVSGYTMENVQVERNAPPKR